MTKRSVIGVLILTFITFGIYHIWWYVKTKDEMVELGAAIPTGWLIIVPFANIYWMWKWCVGVEHVSRGKMSAPVALLLMLLLNFIGTAIMQATFNEVADSMVRGTLPQARIA
jgi:accessory gene regulator protein AgrB